MPGKGSQSTTSTAPDPKTQQWIDLFRSRIGGQLDALPNAGVPDYAGVRNGLVEDFNRMGAQAGLQADDYATKEGAFGGDRSAIFKATALDNVNRDQSRTLSNFDLGANRDQWQRTLQLLGLAGDAAQLGGSKTTQQMPGNLWGDLLGLGVTGVGAYKTLTGGK